MNDHHITSERKEYLCRKKEILYRKAHGKIILNTYLSKVAYMFPSEEKPEILSLEETDVILERFRYAFAGIFKKTTEISTHNLCTELSAIQGSGKSFYVLIDDDWKYCGMLKVDKIETLDVAIEFGRKILNDLFFISVDMSLTVSFDFFEMDGDYLIEIEKRCKPA